MYRYSNNILQYC